MAIFYSRVSVVSRARGHSAVSAAAYRAGLSLRDERTGLRHDYSKKRGVLASRMLAPRGAEWALDPSAAWNRAEQAEVRRNARTAREVVVALPAELSASQNVVLARRLGIQLVERYGVAVQVAVHAPDARGDERNVHTHLLFSTRVATPTGFGAKVRVLDDRHTGPVETEAMRDGFARAINDALAAAGHPQQVDARALAVQAREAAGRGDFDAVVALTRTPQRHQGREATALARAGKPAAAVEANAAVKDDNAAVSRWGQERAGQLRAVVARRAQRWVRPSALGVLPHLEKHRRAMGHGLGALPPTTQASGRDAALLNGQAQTAQASTRAARDAVEVYLDLIRRDAEHLEQVMRAYLARLATPPRDVERWVAAATASATPATLGHLAGACAARDAWEQARPIEDGTRRTAMPATKRQWAEHRRRQREEAARQRWALEHAGLVRHLDGVSPDSLDDELKVRMAAVAELVASPEARPRRRNRPVLR